MSAVRGRLVSASFTRDRLLSLPGAAVPPPAVVRSLELCVTRAEARLGPASSVRSVADAAVIPLLRVLGYAVADRHDAPHAATLLLNSGSPCRTAALVVSWGTPLHGEWRAAVASAIAADARWVFCGNGTSLRVVDGQRTWSREYLEIDLAQATQDTHAQTVLWSLLRAESMAAAPPLMDLAVEQSARHGVDVCRALGAGVRESLARLVGALDRHATAPPQLFEQSLTVLYRVLFLLFAEARGLVPLWHPVYRDRYSIETIVTALLTTGHYRGIWHAIQAITRLAHAGHSADGLRVTAFNGRLFAPGRAGDFERRPIADEVMRRVVLAISSRGVARSDARVRIAYRDLDVEQLGAIYEQVLEYEPLDSARGRPLDSARGGPATLTRTRELRKATGSFYTPRALTAALVRQTLEPLVRGRTANEILALRIVDPAMGSGAILVSACRYLAEAAEQALVREGRWHAQDVAPSDRTELRRTIASRCLYGVDLNPMAVQLARLSLWLVTLATDKPLSFLDHHLITGDSLVGATPDDLQRQPSSSRSRRGRPAPMPLLDATDVDASLEAAARTRGTLAILPDDTVAAVRSKERTLARLESDTGALSRWRRALDLWCAGWFMDAAHRIDRRTFLDLTDHVLRGNSALPRPTAERLLADANSVATARRFVHWPLAFPEAFVDERGQRRPDAGFDAVIGNPPWDMVRDDAGTTGQHRHEARMLAAFAREAGIYRVESRAHANRYQLFVERGLQLTRPGGRMGLILPSGVLSDVGAAPLRRLLFDRASVDSVTGLDNREAIFPIHRSVRFVVLSATAGQPTAAIRCRFGLTQTGDLERDTPAVVLTRPLLAAVSGEDDLGVPEISSPATLAIVERIAATFPPLGSPHGWGVTFGRELNATDDRDAFGPITRRADARPVIEGKHVDPFRVALDRCTLEVRASSPAAARVPARDRLVYRDVASASNRLTIIAAIVPAHAVTTHTVFCLKTPLAIARQRVLAALLNSFVANYLVRLRVTTHVTAGLMARLRVPALSVDDPEATRLVALVRAIERGDRAAEERSEYAELQARIARLYRLTREEFEFILETFPLIGRPTRDAALRLFESLG